MQQPIWNNEAMGDIDTFGLEQSALMRVPMLPDNYMPVQRGFMLKEVQGLLEPQMLYSYGQQDGQDTLVDIHEEEFDQYKY